MLTRLLRSHTTACLAGSIALLLSVVLFRFVDPISQAHAASAEAGTRIAAENALPGADDWTELGNYDITQLAAFAGSTSVNAGDSIDVHIKGTGTAATAILYRLGYYHDHGARRIATYSNISLPPQPECIHDAGTGLVECPWSPDLVIATDPNWLTGVYLLRIDSDNGYRFFVHFVVRNDGDRAAIVVSIEFKTNQAYNDFGGESLYVAAKDSGRSRAYRVSFDRPYATGAGTGTFFVHDVDMVRWLEASGYDLTYISDVDRVVDATILQGHRAFLDVGHDEYWTWAERDHVERALAAGMNMIFASGDESTWNVRLEASPLGSNRIITCYKDSKLDPVTRPSGVTEAFAEPPVNRPIDALIGISYQSWFDESQFGAPWVVSAPADRWYFDCTGLRPGDRINNIVGEEWDGLASGRPRPSGLDVISSGTAYNEQGVAYPQNSVMYQTESGAFVFAAGSIHWSWGLIDHSARASSIPVPKFQEGYLSNDADSRVEQFMANIIDRFTSAWDGGPRNCSAGSTSFYSVGVRPASTPRPVPSRAAVVATAVGSKTSQTSSGSEGAAMLTPNHPHDPLGSVGQTTESSRSETTGLFGESNLMLKWLTAGIAAFDVALLMLGIIWAARRARGTPGPSASTRSDERAGHE